MDMRIILVVMCIAIASISAAAEPKIEVWQDGESYGRDEPIIVKVKNTGDMDVKISQIEVRRIDITPEPIEPESPIYPIQPQQSNYGTGDGYRRAMEEYNYERDKITDNYNIRYEEYEVEYERWHQKNYPYSFNPYENLNVDETRSYTCWEHRSGDLSDEYYKVRVSVSWEEEGTLLEALGLPSISESSGLQKCTKSISFLLISGILIFLLPCTISDISDYYSSGGMIKHSKTFNSGDFYLEPWEEEGTPWEEERTRASTMEGLEGDLKILDVLRDAQMHNPMAVGEEDEAYIQKTIKALKGTGELRIDLTEDEEWRLHEIITDFDGWDIDEHDALYQLYEYGLLKGLRD